MNEKIVTSQAELDAIPVDYKGRIIIKFGTPSNCAIVGKRYPRPVEAYNNSFVRAYNNSFVCAYDSSSVWAYDSSSVWAYGNSSVWAYNRSFVEAYGNSSVYAYGNSFVCAHDESSVCAYDNSSVYAYNNSSVYAHGNSQVVDAHRQGNIKIFGNARIVYNPDKITDWASANGITITGGKIRLYKAVHKRDGKYVADWDSSFVYTVGEVAEANGFTINPTEDCGQGIHMATAVWAVRYGREWGDIALLELEANADEIVVPLYETGKVRAPKALVIREVPLEEAGILGKFLAKRRTHG